MDDVGPSVPDRILFCFCRRESYGEMIGCDDPTCRFEWFHLECVGLTEGTRPRGKWYELRARSVSPECNLGLLWGGWLLKPRAGTAQTAGTATPRQTQSVVRLGGVLPGSPHHAMWISSCCCCIFCVVCA